MLFRSAVIDERLGPFFLPLALLLLVGGRCGGLDQEEGVVELDVGVAEGKALVLVAGLLYAFDGNEQPMLCSLAVEL